MIFQLEWWDGDEYSRSEVFTTTATKQEINKAIEEVQKENPNNYTVHSLLDKLREKGRLVDTIDVTVFGDF